MQKCTDTYSMMWNRSVYIYFWILWACTVHLFREAVCLFCEIISHSVHSVPFCEIMTPCSTVVGLCWVYECKNLNNLTVLHAITTGLVPIDLAWTCTSSTANFVHVWCCESSKTENHLHCEQHTFHILGILAPRQCLLVPTFPLEFMWLSTRQTAFQQKRATFIYLLPPLRKQNNLQA